MTKQKTKCEKADFGKSTSSLPSNKYNSLQDIKDLTDYGNISHLFFLDTKQWKILRIMLNDKRYHSPYSLSQKTGIDRKTINPILKTWHIHRLVKVIENSRNVKEYCLEEKFSTSKKKSHTKND